MTNALLNIMSGVQTPKYDLVGPSVEGDIRRAINRYGRETVAAAAKALTKPRRGRPKLNDWKELHHIIEADAREWLDGGDPMSARSNYAVAKKFAETTPDQSAISTHQRIQRKLAKNPHGRLWFMLVNAELISHAEYSWTKHMRALEALRETYSNEDWTYTLDRANRDLADYEAKNGGPPAETLTMVEVE